MGTKGLAKEERELKVEEQRNRILSAATTVIARKGYHNATMDDIVRETGMSKGNIYWYFKSKKEIFLDLVDRFIDGDKARLIAAIESKNSFVDKLGSLLDTYIQMSCETSDVASFQEARKVMIEVLQQSTIDPEVEARFKQSYLFWMEYGRKMVNNAIAQGEIREVDVEALTAILLAIFDGLGNQWLLNLGSVPAQRVMNTLFDILLKGLQPETQKA